MTRKELDQMMNRLRARHGIALRLIQALPADKLHAHPIPNMRSPAELVVHLYTNSLRELVEGTKRGEILEVDEASIVKGIKTKDDLLQLAVDSFDAATKAASTITDAQLAANVKTPWGSSPTGAQMLEAINDEFFHHRGQLFAYVRALGATPPEMYDFQNNAEEYRPAVHT